MSIGAEKDIQERVEKGLGSPGKLKILKLLLRNPDHLFTRYEIGKKIPLRPVDVRNDLKILVDLGWVKELAIQPRKYSINLEDKVVKELRTFFRNIRYCI
jgi:Fe2+ or Zn2+ uptake regulation protein